MRLTQWQVPQLHSQGSVIDAQCVPHQWELNQVFILRDHSSRLSCIRKYSDSGTDCTREDL
ncbi:hypothetical protein JOB18_032382 [Solea senegalensis]|uniref:DUF5641 domain-containing protein n=1 Tax=Solea senegalensis TaxID=28829 RepID=A0AAV6QP98_SOLSE|nr:hypothetical protein JOB18_032382 [Solea senegalensis]